MSEATSTAPATPRALSDMVSLITDGPKVPASAAPSKGKRVAKASRPEGVPEGVDSEQSASAGRSNDKKAAALRVFEANRGKGQGEIARLIAAELEITYANAYYYVTRVFK